MLFGLEQGNKVLKQINKEMTMERVEKIMDDSAEGIEYQKVYITFCFLNTLCSCKN